MLPELGQILLMCALLASLLQAGLPVPTGSCVTTFRARVPDGIGEWSPRGEYRTDYRIPDEFETSCDLSVAGEYRLQQAYLVPAGIITGGAIDVSGLIDRRTVLRLE